MSAPAINGPRLNATIEALGKIGETPQGMQRVAFSAADVEGRRYVMDLMAEAGLRVRVDAAGNIIARREGSDRDAPAIALGSHVDTVPSGGKYDGALGVLAAIESARTLDDHSVTTRHPLEVLVFTNEEGTTFNRWLLGSRAMAGAWDDDDLKAVDPSGSPLAEYFPRIGGDFHRVEEAARRRGDIHAYLELHIEQGPVLHRTGVPIGVVSGITGRSVFRVVARGMSNHAGTTPMDNRRDALLAASRLVVAVNAIAAEEETCRVGTVGTVAVRPTSAVNVIPGEVELGVEFRDVDMQAIDRAEERLNQVAREIASRHGHRGAGDPAGAGRVVSHRRRRSGRGGPRCPQPGPGYDCRTQRRRARCPGHRRHHPGWDGLRPQRRRNQPLPGGVHDAPRLRQRRQRAPQRGAGPGPGVGRPKAT